MNDIPANFLRYDELHKLLLAAATSPKYDEWTADDLARYILTALGIIVPTVQETQFVVEQPQPKRIEAHDGRH